MTAYASYLQVKRSQVIVRRGHDVIGKFTSSCKAIEGIRIMISSGGTALNVQANYYQLLVHPMRIMIAG